MALEYVVLREIAVSVKRASQGRDTTLGLVVPGMRTRGEASDGQRKAVLETVDAKDAKRLARASGVKGIAPVLPMTLISPSVRRGKLDWAEAVPWGLRAVGARRTKDRGRDIVLAVIDTGIDRGHDAFTGVDFEFANFTSESPQDEDGHGTHCAATIFGRPVGGVEIGVAPGVTRAFIAKVIGKQGARSDQVAKAIQWAVDGGANVISLSLGIDFPGFVAQMVDDGIPAARATTMALDGYRATINLFNSQASLVTSREPFNRPVLLVAAAGNESMRAAKNPFEVSVGPPAVCEGFISVGALGTAGNGLTVADFSNSGPRVSAPGVDIVSAKLGGGLTSMDGTSMAAPHVSGVAALWGEKLMRENRFATQSWVDQLLGKATTRGLAKGFDARNVGAGLIQAPGR